MRQAQRGNQGLARTKGGLNTGLHPAVDGHGLPVKNDYHGRNNR